MKGSTLFRRIFGLHLIVALAGLGVLGLALDRLLERRVVEDLRERLAAEARTVGSALSEASGEETQEQVERLGRASGTRITVIRQDGVVLADSEHDPATMENHAGRREVAAAIRGSVGSDQRTSGTLGKPYLYVAIPREGGLIVRTALAADQVELQRSEVRRLILLSSLGIAFLVLLVSAISARRLAAPLERIAEDAGRIAAGQRIRLAGYGTRETGQLAKAIDDMAQELARVIDENKAESSLREQILASMHEGVILAGRSGELIYSNQAATRMFGREILEKLPAQLDGIGTKEFSVHHPQRRELRSTSVSLADGRILSVIQDETSRKQIDALRTDFVSNASHELKTPVAGILATAETLEDAISEDPQRAPKFAATLTLEARRLSRMVEDLLDLARLEQKAATPRLVDLTRLLIRELARIHDRAEAKNLSVSVHIEDGVTVRGVEDDLGLMVGNLLDNAINYTTRGGLEVVLDRKGGNVQIAVSDTGQGIPTADLDRIFERFYRVDKARSRDTGGTGLGLSIVRNVAERHGGEVAVESELGRGTTFTVRIPSSQR